MSWKNILKSDYQEVPFDAYAGEKETSGFTEADTWLVTGFDNGSIEVEDRDDRVSDAISSNWKNTPPNQIEIEIKKQILKMVDETKEDFNWNIDRNNLTISYGIAWMGEFDDKGTISLEEWLAELNRLDELEQKNN